MKIVIRLFILFIMVVNTTAKAYNYSKEWRKVNADIESDLPESALDGVFQIFNHAVVAGDEIQMLRSAVCASRLESTFLENNVNIALDRLKFILPKMTDENVNICYALIGNSYREYLGRNRYALSENLAMDRPSDDFTLWDCNTLRDTARYYLLKSVTANRNALTKVPNKKYTDVIELGNKEGRRLVYTLYDLLLENALDYDYDLRLIPTESGLYFNPGIYGTMNDFLETVNGDSLDNGSCWNLIILKMLSEANLSSSADVRARIDLRRLELLGLLSEKLGNTKHIEDGRRRLAELYFNETSVSALFMAQCASSLYNSDQAKEALELCQRVVKKYPNSEGGVECANMISEIKDKVLSFQSWGNFIPDEQNLAVIKHKNVSSIYFKVVPVCERINKYGETMIDSLNSIEPVKTWHSRLPEYHDYLSHNSYVSVPSLKAGNYYILASSDKSFSKRECISYSYVEVSCLVFLNKVFYTSSSLSGFVVDNKTGKPVSGCEYTVWRSNESGGSTSTKAYLTGVTDETGAIHIEGMPNGKFDLELSYKDSRKRIVVVLPYHSDIPLPIINRIYSDRYSYRPGDTVHFSGICYSSNGYSIGKVMEGVPLRVTLNDANWQIVDSAKVVSNEFGALSGSMRIPKNALPGRFTLHIEGREEYVVSSATINVEEFVQPTFEILLESDKGIHSFGSEIVVSGMVRTLTGVPLNGAKVCYNVDGRYNTPGILSIHEHFNIASGDTVVDAEGRFVIKFSAIQGVHVFREEEILRTVVSVRVTDLNGETHEQSISVAIGKKDRVIEGSSRYVDGSPVPQICTSLVNLDGDNVLGKVVINVEKLTVPEQPLLRLPVELPTIAQVEEVPDSVKKDFPLYDYTGTLDKSRWNSEKMAFSCVVDMIGEEEFVTMSGLENGTYRVTMDSEGADPVVIYFTVVNPGSNNIPENAQLFVCSDRDSYVVGDTALLRVGSSLKDCTVFYIIENRYGDEVHGVLHLNDMLETLRVPVTEELSGGFVVHLSTVKDRIASNAHRSFTVIREDKHLNVSLTTFREIIEPDSKEDWVVSVSDNSGNPVSASLMLSMYDSALDVYGPTVWLFSPWSDVNIDIRPLCDMRGIYSSSFRYYGNSRQYRGRMPEYSRIVSIFDYPYQSNSLLMRKGDASVLGIMETQVMSLGSDELPAVENEESSVVLKASDIPVRTDNNPTAFFVSSVSTDENGEYKLSFAAPQLLTKWKLIGLAYTKDLKVGYLCQQIVTRKRIMIQPSAPKFLRQGDVIDFTSKVSNLTDSPIQAVVCLELKDAVDDKSLDIIEGSQSQCLMVPAGGSSDVSFRIKIPDNLTALTYTITAETPGNSDGQKETLPVLSSRSQVVSAVSLFNNGSEKRVFSIDNILKESESTTISDEKLTLEYSSSPIWYAVQALPYLEAKEDPTNECLFHRLMANSFSTYVINHNPQISKMLSRWAKLPTDEWQTQLEKNSDLKQVLLSETPWVLESNDEKANLRRLAQSLNSRNLRLEYSSLLDQLLAAQNGDGGWSWIRGYESSTYITTMIVGGIGSLYEKAILNPDKELRLKQAVIRAINYLDAYFYDIYKNGHGQQKEIDYSVLNYLLSRSYFSSRCRFLNNTQESYDFFMKVAENADTHNMGLYIRAASSLLFSKMGNTEIAERLVNTLLERSLYDDEQGRYWRDNVGGYLWHDEPIAVQSMIIRAVSSVPGHGKEVTECQRWLLKQRQTTHWSTAPSTAEAVMALLVNYSQSLSDTIPTTIEIGMNRLEVPAGDVSGGYFIKTWDGPVDDSVKAVTVSTESKNIGWGAVYHRFTDEMDKISSVECGMTIERRLFKVINGTDGDRLVAVDEETRLQVGDRVKVRLVVSTDRNVEFVQVKDMRAAALQPTSTAAGIRYNFVGDLRYYVAPGANATFVYIDRMSKGSYVIEYDLYAQKSGYFGMGIASVQCMYAPAFRASTSSMTVEVK